MCIDYLARVSLNSKRQTLDTDSVVCGALSVGLVGLLEAVLQECFFEVGVRRLCL